MRIITLLVASVGLAALAGCQAKTADENTGDTLQANTLVVDNLDVATDNMTATDMNAMSDMNMTADNTMTTTVNTTTNTTTNSN